MKNKFVIFTDGGARGNPGPAATGFVIFEAVSGKEVMRAGQYIGKATNNQAEYQALITGLTEALSLEAEEIECSLDSELLVRQLNGEYRVKEKKLQELVKQVFRLSGKFKKIVYKHIPREKNKLADRIVNETLDKAGY